MVKVLVHCIALAQILMPVVRQAGKTMGISKVAVLVASCLLSVEEVTPEVLQAWGLVVDAA